MRLETKLSLLSAQNVCIVIASVQALSGSTSHAWAWIALAAALLFVQLVLTIFEKDGGKG